MQHKATVLHGKRFNAAQSHSAALGGLMYRAIVLYKDVQCFTMLYKAAVLHGEV